MANPIAAAGAESSPTRYAALTQQARELTGLVTHRSLYRDGAVPYQVAKFYGGSRFDTIADGINREVTNILTDRRRRGSSVFNANTFPAIESFYSWSFIQDAAEIIRTIADGRDGVIYDATPGQKTALYTKAAGAGVARFQSVNTQLFFGDGVETKKIMRSAQTWKAATSYKPGNFIIDPNGNIQSVQSNPNERTIASVAVVVDPLSIGVAQVYLVVTFTATAPQMSSNRTVAFSGLTVYTALNGQTFTWAELPDRVVSRVLNLQPTQLAFRYGGHVAYADTADTGIALCETSVAGTTGSTQPTWATTWGAVTNDGGNTSGVNWTCFGSAVQNWGVDSLPYASPSYNSSAMTCFSGGIFDFVQFWKPNVSIPAAVGTYLAVLDENGSIQVGHNTLVVDIFAGVQKPNWATTIGGITQDGEITWTCYGRIAPWYAASNYGGASAGVANPCACTDSNGNLQVVSDVTVALASGATPPAWNTSLGGTTADGGVTWVNVGFAATLWSGVYQYAWSAHCIDGSVSTASPIQLIANGGLGPASGFELLMHGSILNSAALLDKQVDQIYLWRTAQDKSTLILLDIIPNPWLLGQNFFQYWDVSDDLDLNAQFPAPISESNDPPNATMAGPIYHLQRIWAIVDNKVVWSGGPDVVTGNGNTSFAPLSCFAYPGRPVALRAVTVENGGILVFTTAGTYIILGTGTAANPFYSTDYYNKVSLLGPNAIELYNNRLFLMESNGKVSALAIEYPFSPQTGYAEIGFPIGDQFKKVTTGGLNATIYDPATTYLSWNVEDTDETGMYVADGAVGWFRMGLMMPPEQEGYNWSPRAQIAAGTSAVQSIVTAPGKSQLLIGPNSSGPILCRDATGTVNTDNGTAFPAWDVKGATLLCSTGQWAEIAHISTKSRAVGARPIISLLMGEIAPSSERPWDLLQLAGKSNDPPLQRASKSAYSDRYVSAQNGQTATGDCVMIRFDYGSQDADDELQDWGMYATVHNERSEDAAKVAE